MAKKKRTSKKVTRKKTSSRRPAAPKRDEDGDVVQAKNGRHRCAHIIKGRNGKPSRRCKQWAAPGSKYCRRHGAASSHARLEESMDDGKHLEDQDAVTRSNRSALGLQRVVSGRFGELLDFMIEELADDDLSQELGTLRAALATQMEEVTSRYEQWREESQGMEASDRAEYWRNYNVMLTRLRQTIDAIRKVVQTIADIRAKQEGNTLTMVQVTVLVGELIQVVTDIIGDDMEKLEQLRSALDRIQWLPT